MLFEEEIIKANEGYKNRGIALVQKISTPWQVVRSGKKIISTFLVEKSTLDFRGTIKGGISISSDCKESEDEKGLPLKYIEDHQIEFMASIPGIQSAINTGSDGMRIKLDIPKTDIAQAIRLITLRRKVFKVIIEKV